MTLRSRAVMIRVAIMLVGLIAAARIVGPALAAPAPALEAEVDEIIRQVASVRGLAVLRPASVTELPRPALIARLSREVSTPAAVRELLTSQMLLEVLGAIPPRGFDLRQFQLDLLDEQLVAVYDHADRTMLLPADLAAPGQLGANERLTLAHEATHALQDQHFDLARVIPAEPTSSDAATAARALVEGDAMLTMRIWGRQFLRPSEKRALGDAPATADDPVMASAPRLVQGELLFPYDAGWIFAQLLYQDGGFEALNAAFQDPPRSTEQILHPEKFLAREAPVTIVLPPLEPTLGGTWQHRRTDTLGELVVRLLLEPHIGWPQAEAAAAGWGGDTYTILEDGSGRRVVAVVTEWDTDGDAAEMYNAFVASIGAQFGPGAARTVTQPSLARWTIPGYEVQALKSDARVRIVYAPDAPTLDLVDAVLGAGRAADPAAAPPVSAPATQPAEVPPSGPAPAAQPTPRATATPTPTEDSEESEPGPAEPRD